MRKFLPAAALAAALLWSCNKGATGPISVSAIGQSPKLINPSMGLLDPPSAYLVEAAAQGLLRFDPAGQVEPALAQSWIVSDDGLRYTFRLARTNWSNGAPVTAAQVVARIRSMVGRSSRNPLKPLLGVIADVQAMTESVLEIRLKAPRPNFLQLLAQPEMAIIRNDQGTGPYRMERRQNGGLLLRLPRDEDELVEQAPNLDVLLRGDRAALAVARFREGDADLVAGGTAGDLPIVRVARLSGAALRFDPTAGLFGLQFLRSEGPLANPDIRRALSMAIDRSALVAAFGVADLAPRDSLLPAGISELPNPALPTWSAASLAERQAQASQAIATAAEGTSIPVRVAAPDAPGYRLLFAYLKRDWRSIGVDAELVRPGATADLVLVDAVAASNVATWYLRHFTCEASRICSPEVDTVLDQARNTQNLAERQGLLASADRVLNDLVPFIPLTAPVRWYLVSPRITGFQANPYGRHFVGGLIASRR